MSWSSQHHFVSLIFSVFFFEKIEFLHSVTNELALSLFSNFETRARRNTALWLVEARTFGGGVVAPLWREFTHAESCFDDSALLFLCLFGKKRKLRKKVVRSGHFGRKPEKFIVTWLRDILMFLVVPLEVPHIMPGREAFWLAKTILRGWDVHHHHHTAIFMVMYCSAVPITFFRAQWPFS